MRNAVDELTGLHNKAHAQQALGRMLQRGGAVAAALIDVDFMTNLNQKLGWDAGNAVLKGLSALFCTSGIIETARYGSDEFLLLFYNQPRDIVCEYLQQLIHRVPREKLICHPEYRRVPVRISAGVSFGGGSKRSVFSLLKSAENALLMAKKQGRSRLVVASCSKMVLLPEGRCCTVAGRNLKGDAPEGSTAFFASIAEPYGVQYGREGEIYFVDRGNHKIKCIRGTTIETVAGCGRSGYAGDGDDARKAMLCKPSGIAYHSPSGRLFIADTGNHVLRMVENGIISTVAGSGRCGYAGDGGEARKASLNRPGGVAVDEEGNLYTNDYGNNVMRRIRADGRIETVAGCGAFGYTGDGGPAVKARLNMPYGMCVSPEGRWLYIADYGNHCIRKVDLQMGLIETLCGDGTAGLEGDEGPAVRARLNGPYWVCLADQRLYLADTNNHQIRYVDLKDATMHHLAGGPQAGYIDTRGPLTHARFCLPAGLDVREDALVVADYGNNAIRQVSLC